MPPAALHGTGIRHTAPQNKKGASPWVVDTLILDLLDPEEARRLPMAMKDYSDEFKADAMALYESTPGATYKSIAADLGFHRAPRGAKTTHQRPRRMQAAQHPRRCNS
jgi:hypothetical protein